MRQTQRAASASASAPAADLRLRRWKVVVREEGSQLVVSRVMHRGVALWCHLAARARCRRPLGSKTFPPRGFFAAVEPVSCSLLSRSRQVPAAACWNELVLDSHVGTCNASAIANRRILQGGLPPQVLSGDVFLQVVEGRADIAAQGVSDYVRLRRRARKILGRDANFYVRFSLGRANVRICASVGPWPTCS